MSYNSAYDLLGKKVSDTYPNLLQSGSDGVFYDGRGNSVTINATIPDIYVKYSQTGSFAITGSNTFTANQTVKGQLVVQDLSNTSQTITAFSAPTESIEIPASSTTQVIDTSTTVADISQYNLAIFDYVITPRDSNELGLRVGQLKVGMYYDETGLTYYTTHTDTSLSDIGTYCKDLEFTNFTWEGTTLLISLQNNQTNLVNIYTRYKLTLI